MSEAVIRLLTLALLAACLPSSGVDLRTRFENPPPEAKLRAWFHWLGDYVTEEGLRADIEAMRRMEIGGYTTVCAAGGAPSRKTAPVMGDEWKRLVALSSKLAREAGMETGMHNCPGWTSSGGPWIRPENAMKKVTSAWRDVRDAEGRLTLERPPAESDFYRDLRTVAFPVEPSPEPVRVTASFDCDAASVARGEGNVPLRAWPEDGECSFTFEYERSWQPRSVAVTFAEKTHIWSKAELSASDDGKAFSKVADLDFTIYNNPATPLSRILTGGKPARFFKMTFRDSKRGAWFKPRDSFLLRGISFASLLVYSGLPGSRYEYRKKSDKDRALVPAIPITDIVDLTDRVKPDGTLDLPRRLKGTWRIVRIGYTLTGHKNHPATLSGLECDKLSPKGVDNHWQGYVEKLLALDGAPTELLIDSYEVGPQTWTEGMEQEFARRCGYDIWPYLPVLAGFVVESHERTERFLFDFSRTVADLMAENYYGRFAAKCRAAGVRSAVEPYFGPFDGFSAGKDFDVTVGEFWLGQPKGLVRTATSLGHLYGKPFIAAESFSAFRENGRWLLTPRQMKAETDWAWIRGINRVTVHSYVHQPDTNRVPGVSLGFFGSHFNRNVPWWNEGVAWSRYVARGQSLLTAGYPLADVLIFNDEVGAGGVPEMPELNAAGYDYDYIGYEACLGLSAGDGEVRFARSPHGYRLLQLRSRNLTLRTLRKIKELLENGASIAALPPFESPSLGDDDAEVRKLVREIWGDAGTGSVRTVGRGRLVLTAFPMQALSKFGVRSPFLAPAPLVAVSRQVDDKCVWFVSNPSDDAVDATAEFAVGKSVRSAELWDATDGSCRPVATEDAEPGRKRIALKLPAHGSIFVVFSPAAAKAAGAPADPRVIAEISGPWQVAFEGLAAPAGTFAFARLESWSDRPEPELNAFSGRATYRTTFDSRPTSGRLYVELGDVRDAARVRVNGREAGIAWTPPYRVDISGLVKAGKNELELEVANNWPNRLIGDARARKAGRQGVTWTNYADAWKAEDKFIPAGLLGPVRLLSADD